MKVVFARDGQDAFSMNFALQGGAQLSNKSSEFAKRIWSRQRRNLSKLRCITLCEQRLPLALMPDWLCHGMEHISRGPSVRKITNHLANFCEVKASAICSDKGQASE